MVVWAGFALLCGLSLQHVLSAPARSLGDAGRSLAARSDDLSERTQSLTELPVLGDSLSQPLRPFVEATRSLSETATSAADSLEELVRLVGWSVTGGLVVSGLAVWGPPRLFFVVRASRMARGLSAPGARRILALRALHTAPLQDLSRISDDPQRDVVAGNPESLQNLASLALRPYGLSVARLSDGGGLSCTTP